MKQMDCGRLSWLSRCNTSSQLLSKARSQSFSCRILMNCSDAGSCRRCGLLGGDCDSRLSCNCLSSLGIVSLRFSPSTLVLFIFSGLLVKAFHIIHKGHNIIFINARLGFKKRVPSGELCKFHTVTELHCRNACST